MDPSFIPVEVVPSKTPFGLDQLRRSYKTALSAEAAIAAAPAVGAVDEVFPCMFLMPITTPERAESATRIDLLYMGTIQFTGTGVEGDPFVPVLPDQKTEYNTAVQSATSSKLNTGLTLASPATLQYYAPTSQLTYFTFGAPGTTQAPAPDGSPIPITLTISDTTYSSGGGIQSSIDALFTLQVISTIDSTEIVPGQYWQNVARTQKLYSPWIFDVASGPYVTLYNPGVNYTAGDTLSISSGGEGATINVISVGSVFGAGGGILTFTASSVTFTSAHTALPASGGSGSDAGFNVFIIP
jgi:hypothetical protein